MNKRRRIALSDVAVSRHDICWFPTCYNRCPKRELFCLEHWKRLPGRLKQQIYDIVNQDDYDPSVHSVGLMRVVVDIILWLAKHSSER